MKLLSSATLFAIFIKCITASAFSETELGQAIDRRDFETVKELCKQNEALCEEGINYVIDTKDPDFIAEFIKKAELLTGYTILAL